MLKGPEETGSIKKDIPLAQACIRDVIVVGLVTVASG